MENIMGSHMRLIRRIVDGAGDKKILSQPADNESEMIVMMIQK